MSLFGPDSSNSIHIDDDVASFRIFMPGPDPDRLRFVLRIRGQGSDTRRDVVKFATSPWQVADGTLTRTPAGAVWHLRISAEFGGALKAIQVPEGTSCEMIADESVPGGRIITVEAPSEELKLEFVVCVEGE